MKFKRVTMNIRQLSLATILCAFTLAGTTRCEPARLNPLKRAVQVGSFIAQTGYGRQLVASGTLLFTSGVLAQVVAQPTSNGYLIATSAGGALLLINVATGIVHDWLGDDFTEFWDRFYGLDAPANDILPLDDEQLEDAVDDFIPMTQCASAA